MAPEYLFVYGTLRQGAVAHAVLDRACTFVGDAAMPGALYDVDGYPGAIQLPDRTGMVRGEVYALPPESTTLDRLDRYEGCAPEFPHPHEYVRLRVPVSLADGRTLSAWAYIYNRDTSSLIEIMSGDYLNRSNG
ncbi:MAG: gamma-glutamylcyclotransferase [Alphaproteobacteria bacterium]|nr:gamma-glutamylcyclotransferase [Alphaproteobacteria bacterium]